MFTLHWSLIVYHVLGALFKHLWGSCRFGLFHVRPRKLLQQKGREVKKARKAAEESKEEVDSLMEQDSLSKDVEEGFTEADGIKSCV